MSGVGLKLSHGPKLDCPWVRSLVFNFLGEQGFSIGPTNNELFAEGSTATKIGADESVTHWQCVACVSADAFWPFSTGLLSVIVAFILVF